MTLRLIAASIRSLSPHSSVNSPLPAKLPVLLLLPPLASPRSLFPDFDNMTKIKELWLYCVMIICYFYVLSVMMATCATKQRNVRKRMIQREIVSTSVKRRKQHEYHNMRFMNDFMEMVGPGFKSLSEAVAHEEARDEAREKAREVARAKIEERKKLLPRVIFEIEGLSDDEAMFILQVLISDEDDLNIFFDLPDNKKLCFCRLLLSRSSFSPPKMFLSSSRNSRLLTDPFGGIFVYRCSPTAGACSEV